MGGAGGHMSHPYDLDEVTDGAGLIKMLMSIPAHLAMDDVNATIKLDGSNNSVKVIDRRGKFEFALDRGAMGLGKGEMDYQGLTPDDYEARQLNPGLQSSTNILLGILNDALDTANIEPELKAIGLIDEDGKADYSKFLNTEFYDKENSNSIDYKIGNFIAFHGVYQFYEKFHRRGKPDAKQVRAGLPRPTYVDKKDNKEKYKKVTSTRVQYDAKALESLVKKVRPFAKKAGFELLGPAATTQKNKDMAKEAIADMKASLSKQITIQISKERAETKTLEKWLKESVNPLTTKYKLEDGSEVYLGCGNCIRMADGSTTNPYNKKKVYEPIIINKVPIVDYYANSDGQINAMAALNSAILFHGTRLLGQDIKNHLTTEVFGDVNDHEGIVIRDLASEDFKITGEFMVDDSGGFAQKRPAQKDEYLQEDEEDFIGYNYKPVKEDEDEDPVVDADYTGETIAFVPGAFKPPHMGHLKMVEQYARRSDIDRVIILISSPKKKNRMLDDGTVINATHAEDVWKLLLTSAGLADDPKVDLRISKEPSPIGATLDMIGDNGILKPGDRVILGASNKPDDSKDEVPDWHRWLFVSDKDVKEGVEVMDLESNAVKAFNRQGGTGGEAAGPFRATDMRSLISKAKTDVDAIDELEEFVGEENVFELLAIFGMGPRQNEVSAEIEEANSSGTVGSIGYGAAAFVNFDSEENAEQERQSRLRTINKENVDLSMLDEVMKLIIGKGIAQ